MDYLSVSTALVCIVIVNTALWVAFARKPHPHNKTGDQGREPRGSHRIEIGSVDTGVRICKKQLLNVHRRCGAGRVDKEC